MKPANAQVVGMTRSRDHATSIAAAEKIEGRKLTIREQVDLFAKSRPFGFTDDDLKIAWPTTEAHPCAESSYRRRRTELCEENIICPRGDMRKNRAGNDETIWIHRDHLLFPPPQKTRQAKPSRFAALQEENARLRAALRTAVMVAEEARAEWDRAPDGMKAGKVLMALSGNLPGYRRDIDSVHEALA